MAASGVQLSCPFSMGAIWNDNKCNLFESNCSRKLVNNQFKITTTLESVIDIGQGISIGPGRFGKKNKRRALNKRRAWKIWKKE